MIHRLWDHQEKAIKLAAAEFSRGKQAVCIVMPTGAGKTRTGGAICVRHLQKNPNGKIVWCAHREELVSQAFDDLTTWGLSCGVIQSNPTRTYNPYRRVQVASTQTLLARGAFPDSSLLVLDEMHHYASDKWEQLGLEYRKKRVPIIGLTATPIRGDQRGFEGLMDSLVCPITMSGLIEQGFLTPYKLHAPKQPLKPNQIALDPHVAYQKYAEGRKTIVFATNVKAARLYKDQFLAAGISCELVFGDMPADERRAVLEDYKAGRIQVLTNVGVLTEGFDDRPTSCVILARSVGSLSLYLQMCGRALRASPETGKTDAVIIDLYGSCRVHGEPADEREWTLDGEGVRGKKKIVTADRFCAVCKVLLEPDAGLVCDLCGYARPDSVPPTVANVQLVRYEAKLRETPEQRRAYFAKLVAIAQSKSYSKWWPHAKYKAIYGERPSPSWG